MLGLQGQFGGEAAAITRDLGNRVEAGVQCILTGDQRGEMAGLTGEEEIISLENPFG